MACYAVNNRLDIHVVRKCHIKKELDEGVMQMFKCQCIVTAFCLPNARANWPLLKYTGSCTVDNIKIDVMVK